MTGLSMNELYERVSHSHEVEFEYNGTTYVLQPEVSNKKDYLVIWDCTPDVTMCIARYGIISNENISKNAIDHILSVKCFSGKSFMEIEKYITVTLVQ